jgi:hypothetical protein
VKFLPQDGGKLLKPIMYLSDIHFDYLPLEYFEPVGKVTYKPKYTNKKSLDPFAMQFYDSVGIKQPEEWGLPKPNEQASYQSLSKYAKNLLPMDERQIRNMNIAWTWVEKHFGPHMQNSIIVDQETSILSMDMTTSTGFPWNTQYPTKNMLFEKYPEIRDWLLEDWEKLTQPTWTMFATNSLKEEIRTKEKIELNKIRTFMSLAVQGTVHGNRLFLDMNQKMYDSHLTTASYVGASPFDGNWHLLYKKLSKFQDGFSMDEKEYDSSLRAFLMWACAKFRFNMLAPQYQTEENKLRVQHYYINLIHTSVIGPDGVVTRKQGGNPSGSVNTITDNTIILYSLLAYAWLQAHEVTSYSEFEQNTAKALNGDDNIWTVSKAFLPTYNARTLIREWTAIGVTTVTDSLEPQPVENLDFLSARFYEMKGVMVPLYNQKRLLTTILYSVRSKHNPAFALERLGGVLAIGWCDPVFRHFCRQYQSYLVRKYDAILCDEKDWQNAKATFTTDENYEKHFLGILNRQSVETQERSDEPLKIIFNIMAAKADRAMRYLDALVNKGLLTSDGEKWLVEAIDPYNDLEPDAAAFPSGENIASVPLVMKKTIELRKPTAVPAGNWTCSIFTMPITTPVLFNQAHVAVPPVGTQGYLPVGFGGVGDFTIDMINAHGALDGVNLAIFDISNATKIASLGPTSGLGSLTEKFKIVSAGWEVWNTTAPLVTQGIGTFWRQPANPDPETKGFTPVGGGAILNGSSTAAEMPLIPANMNQALAMEGTVQWAAKEGNYTVIPFNSAINLPVASSSARKGIYFVDRTNPLVPRMYAQNVAQVPYVLPAVAYAFGAGDYTTQQQTGAIYSGLPETATLTLNLKVYLELLPGAFLPAEQNFSRVARKAPAFDAAALQFYGSCLNHMPISVMVKENGFGDWFMGAANSILNFATPILKAIPHPAAQGFGTVASVAQGLTNQYQNRKNANSMQVRIPATNTAPKVIPKLPPRDQNYQNAKANFIAREANILKKGEKKVAKAKKNFKKQSKQNTTTRKRRNSY